MATKNEEKRLIELRKRQQFKQHASKQSASHSQTPKKGGNPRYENTSSGSHRNATRERIDPKTAKCNTCSGIGHFQRDCKILFQKAVARQKAGVSQRIVVERKPLPSRSPYGSPHLSQKSRHVTLEIFSTRIPIMRQIVEWC